MTYSQCSGSWGQVLEPRDMSTQVYSSAGGFKEVNVGMPTVSG